MLLYLRQFSTRYTQPAVWFLPLPSLTKIGLKSQILLNAGGYKTAFPRETIVCYACFWSTVNLLILTWRLGKKLKKRLEDLERRTAASADFTSEFQKPEIQNNLTTTRISQSKIRKLLAASRKPVKLPQPPPQMDQKDIIPPYNHQAPLQMTHTLSFPHDHSTAMSECHSNSVVATVPCPPPFIRHFTNLHMNEPMNSHGGLWDNSQPITGWQGQIPPLSLPYKYSEDSLPILEHISMPKDFTVFLPND